MSKVSDLLKEVLEKEPLPEWVNAELRKRGYKICEVCKLIIKDKVWIVVEDKEIFHCECFYENFTPLDKQFES